MAGSRQQAETQLLTQPAHPGY